jgi:hypothetical protein
MAITRARSNYDFSTVSLAIMRTIEGHSHLFPSEAWPFKEPSNSASFTTARLWSERLPILRAFHSPDGDWQFFNGDIAEDDECLMVCMGCMYERDATVATLGTLPPGWSATREFVGGAWQREPYEETDG